MADKDVEEFISRIDSADRMYGRTPLSELLATVTLPDDLSEDVVENVRKARAGHQRISDNALKCLALHQRGEMTHKRYVDLAGCFADYEGITPSYLRPAHRRNIKP